MSHYLLLYTVTQDYLERRPLYRDEHLRRAWDAERRGELVLAGALADPADTGLLLFRTRSRDVIEQFARQDPYVVNGLVSSWHIREWQTVVGKDAVTAVYPTSYGEVGSDK
jgi:uncharacterized protein